jgi:putative ABC transport system substrate-binding protein
MPVLGYLRLSPAVAGETAFKGFHQGLGETGFVENRNLVVEYRFADFQPERLPGLAADLVGHKVDVIAAFGGPSALAAKSATSTIPIVFLNGSDPVKAGLVASLNRPGGNLTGVTLLTTELGPKRLELLRELVPGGAAIAMLVDPNNPDSRAELEQVERAAQSLGQKIRIVHASKEAEFEAAFQEAVQVRCAAILVSTGGLFGQNPSQLAGLAERYAIPAIFDRRESVTFGGVISYGTRFAEVGRRAGIVVGRVLKGEKPADLPVEQPTIFELVVNLKTAKALGLTVPPTILARADEFIE